MSIASQPFRKGQQVVHDTRFDLLGICELRLLIYSDRTILETRSVERLSPMTNDMIMERSRISQGTPGALMLMYVVPDGNATRSKYGQGRNETKRPQLAAEMQSVGW